MANIKLVAERAGVSISTVSRVINGSKNVSPSLKEKVEAVVKELDYTANTLAKGLKSSKSNVIAVVITAISRSFFTTVLEGIHEVAAAAGYSVMIAETFDQLEKEIHILDDFASQWVDGIILASSAYEDDEETKSYIDRLHRLSKKEHPLPVVTLEFPVDNPHVDAVVIDHEQAAYDATRILIDKMKRKNVVHLCLPPSHLIGRQRISGFTRAMREGGYQVDESNLIPGNYSPYSGYMAAEDIIRSGKRFDGVFCANDEMAVGFIKACVDNGLKIPDDVAIIGNDDIFFASVVSPTLSSIHVPKREMGRMATELLLKRIENGEMVENRVIHMLDYTIKERQTTNKDAEESFEYLKW